MNILDNSKNIPKAKVAKIQLIGLVFAARQPVTGKVALQFPDPVLRMPPPLVVPVNDFTIAQFIPTGGSRPIPVPAMLQRIGRTVLLHIQILLTRLRSVLHHQRHRPTPGQSRLLSRVKARLPTWSHSSAQPGIQTNPAQNPGQSNRSFNF